MSNKIIDCVFYHDNKTSLKNRVEKYSEVVDKFVIFYKKEIDIEFLTGTTKPIELVLVEEELYITELVNYIKKSEYDFEDVISISVTNEFYQTEIIEDVVKLLPFGPVLLEKYIFYPEPDPIQHKIFRGTLFLFNNQIKFDVHDTKKIWLGKQKYDGKDVNILKGGYQD
jgi:hypothetical protein